MIKVFKILFLVIIASSCSGNDPKEQLKHLDGYWEIKTVEFSKDSVREYKFNEMIDFFELENGVGFRKKVRPQIDGSYKITQDAEAVDARIENGNLHLYYTTPFDSWKEKVLRAGEENLSLQTEEGIIYHYKRFTPLNIYDEEE